MGGDCGWWRALQPPDALHALDRPAPPGLRARAGRRARGGVRRRRRAHGGSRRRGPRPSVRLSSGARLSVPEAHARVRGRRRPAEVRQRGQPEDVPGGYGGQPREHRSISSVRFSPELLPRRSAEARPRRSETAGANADEQARERSNPAAPPGATRAHPSWAPGTSRSHTPSRVRHTRKHPSSDPTTNRSSSCAPRTRRHADGQAGTRAGMSQPRAWGREGSAAGRPSAPAARCSGYTPPCRRTRGGTPPRRCCPPGPPGATPADGHAGGARSAAGPCGWQEERGKRARHDAAVCTAADEPPPRQRRQRGHPCAGTARGKVAAVSRRAAVLALALVVGGGTPPCPPVRQARRPRAPPGRDPPFPSPGPISARSCPRTLRIRARTHVTPATSARCRGRGKVAGAGAEAKGEASARRSRSSRPRGSRDKTPGGAAAGEGSGGDASQWGVLR